MALPGFYNQGDQDIYTGGEHFIPQEQYRLGYPNTPPPSIANASTGITNTQAASPYIWPPQGYYPGDGGGGGTGNKFGLNLDTQKDFKAGVWSTDISQNPPGMDPMTASYKPENRTIAQDQSGNWKFVDTGKNVYHANINAKPMFASLLEKAAGIDLKGKYGLSDEFTARKLGSTTGYEWDEEEMDIGTRRRVPQNIIQRWKENREIKKEMKKEQKRIAEDRTGIGEYDRGTFTGPHPDAPTKTPEQGGWHPGVGGNGNQGNTGGYTGGNKSPGHPSNRAQGGRIGYERGRVVNPGGYKGEEEGEFSIWKPSTWSLGGPESETNPTLFGTQNSLMNKTAINNLERAIGFYEAAGDLDQEQQLDYELKLKQLEALIAGAKGQAQGGLIGYFDGGIARLL